MYTFLGVMRCEFKDKETGEPVEGWNLWLAEPSEGPSVGFRPIKKWLTNERAEAIFAPYGGISACQKYAGKLVEVTVGLRGQVMALHFDEKKGQT